MGFGTTTVKYVLFIFNLLCALIGIAIIALGAVVLGNVKSFDEFMDSVKAVNFPIAVIVLGCLICIIAFFGCCGAIRESHCMIITYSVFLFVLLVLQIVIVVVLFVNQETIKNEVEKAVEKMWAQSEGNRDVMDSVQKIFQCCGKNGPLDYGVNIPQSCCPEGKSCIVHFYKVGCKEATSEAVLSGTKNLAYVGLVIFAVELIGFIFACCLGSHIRNEKRRGTY